MTLDWPTILGALGDGDRSIGLALGVARSTVRGWRAGGEPKHCDGELILQHWTKATGKPREQAPRQPR
jgi:hypothetical protein